MNPIGHFPAVQPFMFDQILINAPTPGHDHELMTNDADAKETVDSAFGGLESTLIKNQAFEEGRHAGYEDGLQEGMEIACRTIESQIAGALTTLTADVARIAVQQQEMFEAMAEDCDRLVRIVLERLLPETVERAGCDEIAGVVRMALTIGCNDPVVEVRMSPDLANRMRPRLEKLARDAGFRGKLDLAPDNSIAPGAVQTRWLHGGAHRDPEKLLAEISALTGWNLRKLPAADAIRNSPNDEEVES